MRGRLLSHSEPDSPHTEVKTREGTGNYSGLLEGFLQNCDVRAAAYTFLGGGWLGLVIYWQQSCVTIWICFAPVWSGARAILASETGALCWPPGTQPCLSSIDLSTRGCLGLETGSWPSLEQEELLVSGAGNAFCFQRRKRCEWEVGRKWRDEERDMEKERGLQTSNCLLLWSLCNGVRFSTHTSWPSNKISWPQEKRFVRKVWAPPPLLPKHSCWTKNLNLRAAVVGITILLCYLSWKIQMVSHISSLAPYSPPHVLTRWLH